jgi:hypothetical protein
MVGLADVGGDFPVQRGLQLRACAGDTALDRSDGAPTDRGHLPVRQPMRDDQNQCLAPQRRQLLNDLVELLHRQRVFLARSLKQDLIDFVERLEADPTLAEAGNVQIAQDGECPRLEIAAWLKLVHGSHRPDHRILHQVVRPIVFTA